MSLPVTTTTNIINYSGLLYTRTDESTRFLDAVYARGKNGGRTPTQSIEFVLASGYDMDAPTQPNISEQASLTAPSPETTERDQEWNVAQIFHRSVAVSYSKMSNVDMLGGVNLAGASNNVANELDFQVERRVSQMRKDLNWTLINGVFQYTKGSITVAPRTRGIMTAIATNSLNANNAALTPLMLNNLLIEAIANGADPSNLEIWVNPKMLGRITAIYAALPGFSQPPSREEGGLAVTRILTDFGWLSVYWEPEIADGQLLLVDMSQMAVAEKQYVSETGEVMGALIYEPLAKIGASERGQLYGELGLDYGAEWHHARISNLATT